MKYWIIGAALAFAGAGVVRLIAPQCEAHLRVWIMLAGYNIAFAGLFVILLGTRKRGRERAKHDSLTQNK